MSSDLDDEVSLSVVHLAVVLAFGIVLLVLVFCLSRSPVSRTDTLVLPSGLRIAIPRHYGPH